MIGFASAAVAATAAFLGDKRRASQFFNLQERLARTFRHDPRSVAPSQDYACIVTNFESLLQSTMLGLTGIRLSEGDWRKYPATLPAGWNQIEINRVWVKGAPMRLIALDGAPAKLLST